MKLQNTVVHPLEPLIVEKLIPGGQALATAPDGKKIFLWNALPGEVITDYQPTKIKSHFTEAVMVNIIAHSKHRVKPEDPCFLSTSPWQIMDYDFELSEKQALVVELFREHHIAIDTPEIITDGRPYHYRNKMEYALYWDHATEQISPAFHARGSHRKVPVTKSSIERPEIFAAATEIIDDLNRQHAEARRFQSLLLRCSQNGEVSGGLFENGQPHPRFPHLTDTILGHEYSYSPNGFFQINLPVYELALEEIKKHVLTDEVLDLYAGVGTIGLSVARDKTLTMVECDRSAFAEMTRNITSEGLPETVNIANGIAIEDISERGSARISAGHPWHSCDRTRVQNGNTLAISTKSEDALDYISRRQTIILDPPRSGCDAKLIDRLLEVEPPKIIYLSCNPATQARDVAALLPKYHIETIKTYNFFPRTPHIENLIVLSL